MILVRHIHWRLMALPTPFFVLLVTLGPAPLIIPIEAVKRLYRRWLRWRCLCMLKRQHKPLFIYTNRPDSTVLLERQVLPKLDVTALVLDKMQVQDKQFKAVRGILPRQLGYAFPLLVFMRGNEMIIEPLHQHVYTETLQLREAQDIIAACQRLIRMEQ